MQFRKIKLNQAGLSLLSSFIQEKKTYIVHDVYDAVLEGVCEFFVRENQADASEHVKRQPGQKSSPEKASAHRFKN